ncbi:copper transporter [Dermatophilaceae bacterium Soc4.6]
MIDFRYHLVSIVSIFVALAVGIVLGAGPLQGGIGTQLTDQVSQLRQDMETLRTQRDDNAKTVTAQEGYAAAVASSALSGRLKGQTVALLVSSDAAGKFAELTTTALQQAGATVTTVVTLKDAFRAPESAPDRLTAATTAAAAMGLTPTSDADELLAQVLTSALVQRPAGSGTGPTTPGLPSASSTRVSGEGTGQLASASALRTLGSAGLLDLTNDNPAPASLAVVLGGPISGTTTSVTAQTATMTALLRVLASATGGVVVGSGAPTTAVGQETTTNLVTAVRADGRLAGSLSSVDHADSVVGAGVVVLALAAQEGGRAGHYGISADAKADVPPTT